MRPYFPQSGLYTKYPGSLDNLYIRKCYIRMDKTSGTYSMPEDKFRNGLVDTLVTVVAPGNTIIRYALYDQDRMFNFGTGGSWLFGNIDVYHTHGT